MKIFKFTIFDLIFYSIVKFSYFAERRLNLSQVQSALPRRPTEGRYLGQRFWACRRWGLKERQLNKSTKDH